MLCPCRGEPPHPNTEHGANDRGCPAQFHWDGVTSDDYRSVFKQANDMEGSDDCENQ